MIEQSSFWHRQLGPRITAPQIAFDLACGIALPVICLYFDPIVFQSSDIGAILGRYAVVARVAIGLGFLSLCAWLLTRWPPGLMAGLLAGGATFATLLGLVLLPFSIIGLFAFIGVLGFSPFVTAFVFWRNAIRAYRRSRSDRAGSWSLIPAVVGLAITCAGPWAAQSYVAYESSRAIIMVQSEDAAEAAQGVARLKRLRAFADYDRIVFVYDEEKNEGRRQRLAAAYRELTGTELENRLLILRD